MATNSSQTAVGHCKKDDVDVYVGRGFDGETLMDGLFETRERGWLGNPFTLNEYSREESVGKFETAFVLALQLNPEFRDAVQELSGKTLGCWCQELDADGPACHGEVIAKWADRLAQ